MTERDAFRDEQNAAAPRGVAGGGRVAGANLRCLRRGHDRRDLGNVATAASAGRGRRVAESHQESGSSRPDLWQELPELPGERHRARAGPRRHRRRAFLLENVLKNQKRRHRLNRQALSRQRQPGPLDRPADGHVAAFRCVGRDDQAEPGRALD